jgi:hypothetical protein
MISTLVAAVMLASAAQAVPADTAREFAPVQRVQSSVATGPSDPSATELEDIVVQGRRLQEAATEFVTEVGATPYGARRARWHAPVCISVTNMRAPYGQFLVDRIATRAADLGLDIGEPWCRPNVIILATSDGPALGKRLVDEAGLGFRPTVGPTNLDREALRRFRTSADPIRWWHVAIPVSAETGQVAVRMRGEEAPTLVVRSGSRLTSSLRYDLGWVIIVIDMSRTRGVPLGVVADYSAMVALAQINPEADMSSFDTVLNAFQHPEGVAGLSDWDRDYLHALYTSPTDRKNEAQQDHDLVDSLLQGHEATQSSPIQ